MTVDDVQTLDPDERKALRVFLRHVRRALGPRLRRIVLYGSKARGDAVHASDIDLLVIVDRESRRVHEAVAEAAYEATVASRSFVAAYTVSERYWRNSRRAGGLFARNVERDGVELTA